MTGEPGIVVTMFKAVVGTFTGRYPDHESGTDEKDRQLRVPIIAISGRALGTVRHVHATSQASVGGRPDADRGEMVRLH